MLIMKLNKRKSIMLSFTAILIALVVAISITYALWSQSHEQTNANLVESGCFNVVFEELNSAINLANIYPITDVDGLNSEPYIFKLKNTCSITAEYMVKLEITNNSTLSLDKVKVALDDEVSILSSNEMGTSTLKKAGVTISDTYIIYTGILLVGEEIAHELREWIDYSATTMEASNKVLNSYLTIEAVATDKVPIKHLNKAILAQFGGAVSIVEAPVGTFASVSSASDALMYKMEDDYGISYYYRGAKDLLKNNLIFAEHQWKIIRINGNDSVRIIYNGTCPNNECTINSTGTSTQIKTAAFNTNNNDAKYVGYMYGGPNGTTSTSRAQAVTNETSSNVKTELESWYTTYIEIKGYSSYISDTLFCNDRRLQSEVGGSATGPGYGNVRTNYASYYRLNANKIPTLMCGDKNDMFTVNETEKENGVLTYPVGLISADEISLAGGAWGDENTSYYLCTNQYFLSLSPSGFYSSSAYVWAVNERGVFNLNSVLVSPGGVRSVLNLKFGVRVTGTGSATDPFVVI